MKNVITVIAFTLVTLLGINSAVAQGLTQDADRPEVIAKTKTADLSETLQLNGDQQRSVFRALVANEVSYKKNISGKNPSDAQVISDKKKFDDALMTSMKKTLTPEQFEKWITLPKQ
ncbi:MAG: hypothetical protein ACJAUR_001754 [Ulvibacter sp.]|jgi:hypothetical protein|tara:strand:+ start:2065 stop:2415 length:351 start_codon:yes stop_codon:yes gene_type:complete